jgi:hypothetical protein
MTTTTMGHASIGKHRAGETVSRPGLEPIYTELARRWERAGRLVPGRDDEEWTILADRCPWPGL